jgi:hypothetical protein
VVPYGLLYREAVLHVNGIDRAQTCTIGKGNKDADRDGKEVINEFLR